MRVISDQIFLLVRLLMLKLTIVRYIVKLKAIKNYSIRKELKVFFHAFHLFTNVPYEFQQQQQQHQ